MSDGEPTLSGLRAEIDRLDDALVDLMVDRARLVAAIGSLKGAGGEPVLRPGREAEILRRLLARAGSAIEGAQVVRVWREIVSAAVRQQGPFTVACSIPENGPSCWALARDQYGWATPIAPMPGPVQVAAAVAEGAATIGVVPRPASDDSQPWWPLLMAENTPRVIARLPAAEGLEPAAGCTEGFALAMMEPEPSGEDRTLIAFETQADLARSRVHAALEEAGFTVHATWYHEAGDPDVHDSHLAEVEGFIDAEATGLPGLKRMLGDALRYITPIGSFANPPRVGPAAVAFGKTPVGGGS